MKTTLTTITIAAMLTAFATIAHAETKVITQGRSGFTVIHVEENRATPRNDSKDTRVALMMEKPQQSAQYKTIGRAGFRVVPAGNHGH